MKLKSSCLEFFSQCRKCDHFPQVLKRLSKDYLFPPGYLAYNQSRLPPGNDLIFFEM